MENKLNVHTFTHTTEYGSTLNKVGEGNAVFKNTDIFGRHYVQ